MELLKERAQLFNVDIPEEIIDAIELGEELKDYCARIADEISVHVDCIDATYSRELEKYDTTHTFWGESIPEAVKQLNGIAQELRDISHGR